MIYCDHNATSPINQAHSRFLFEKFTNKLHGNPSSSHAAGRESSVTLQECRKKVAASLGAHVSEVIFTSGGSEANNTIIQGLTSNATAANFHVIASAIEHPCILEPLRKLHAEGVISLSIVEPAKSGCIQLHDIQQCLRKETQLICLMAANNETGARQPVLELGLWLLSLQKAASKSVSTQSTKPVHFHCDAVQAWGKLPTREWMSAGMDSCSVSGHKLGGIAGIGVLYCKKGRSFNPLILGGSQERSRRAGTENVLGAISIGLVAEHLMQPLWWESTAKLQQLRESLRTRIELSLPVLMNCSAQQSLPNTINFSLLHHKAEDVLMELDIAGIYASSGSACSSSSQLPSHVLLAQGREPLHANNAIRISLGLDTIPEEIEQIYACLSRVIGLQSSIKAK